MRRLLLMAAVVPLVLAALLLPPVEAGAELGPPAEAGGGEGGFHGFAGFDTHAEGRVFTLTGFLGEFREDNSLVGAVSEINGPPANSRNIAAFFYRGRGATFVYGVIGGPGGARGTLPDPPPGEANAYFPTDDPPYEMTWSGPITGAGAPQAVDSRFHAKATDTPTGRAEGAVTGFSDPGYLTVGQAAVVSHTEPAEGGVAAESVSVLHQVQLGPLLIQNIVSRAYAFVPTSGDPKGIATTVVDGAKVGDTPVQITDKGLVVADKTNPLNQQQVNKAMADAGYPQVRLIPSVAKPGDDGASVSSQAGTLEFVKQDQKFGASNPQGFSGGGFSVGGAEAFVNTRRCATECGGGGGGSSDVVGGATGSLPDGSSSSSEPPPSSSAAGNSDLGGYDANSSSAYTTDTSGAGLSSSGAGASGSLSTGGGSSGGGLSLGEGTAGDSGSTTAATPPGVDASASAGTSGQVAGGGVPLRQQTAVAVTELGPKSAEWLRDLYLMAALALGIIFVGQRLARAFS